MHVDQHEAFLAGVVGEVAARGQQRARTTG